MSDLPRSAVEQVLARAAELQMTSDAEPGETISEARLLDIAREVGLDAVHIRQAIAEHRAHALASAEAPAHGADVLSRALGPASIGAQRTVPGSPLALLDLLDAYLPQGELLTRVRRTTQHTSWEPRRDPFGNLLRGLGVGGRRYDFVRSDQLLVTVTQLDEARSVVRVDTVWHRARRTARANAIAVGVALALFVLAAAIPLMALGLVLPPFAVLTMAMLLVLAIGGSVWHWRATQRRYREQLARAQTRIESLLDEIEHERLRPPPTVVERLLGR